MRGFTVEQLKGGSQRRKCQLLRERACLAEPCVLFVGGIDVDCDEAARIKYCRSKNVRVSSCRFLRSKLFGTKSARLSVSAEDAEAANILVR